MTRLLAIAKFLFLCAAGLVALLFLPFADLEDDE